MLSKVLRMFKSSVARKKRNDLKELKDEIQERKFKRARQYKKKTQKLKKRHHDGR